MKQLVIIMVLVFLVLSIGKVNAQDSRTISFDKNWRFKKDSLVGAESPAYNDSGWRTLNLPHDWSIEDLPNQVADSVSGPFSKAAISGRDGGFTIGGTAWYRKHFNLPMSARGKDVYLQFDGVYRNSDVWINGHHLGFHPYGYTSFYYNLSPFLLLNKDNVIAVRVINEGVNNRWYSGSGIYRHVWLTTVNPLHIATWGTSVTTPLVSNSKASVSVSTSIANSKEGGSFKVLTEIYNPLGLVVGKNLQNIANSKDSLIHVDQMMNVVNPKLWSVENPRLYIAKTTILKSNKIIDVNSTYFGIRSIRFDSKTGFLLNGISTKLHGGCIHHDNGPLGAAAIDRAEERKIELLKQQGYNAIRLSHNPPSPQLLNACDRLGMLVIDEAFDMWEQPKTPQDYHLYFDRWSERDITSMVLRDRNHPSIIMWSIGNEIPEVIDSSGYAIGKRLSESVHNIDDTRPVTMAIPLFATLGKKGKTWDNTAPAFANLDVSGYNYAYLKYESDHEKFPDRVMYASEYFPIMGIGNWQKVEKLPYVIGTFSWTAMDYLGEAGIGVARLLKKSENNNRSSSPIGDASITNLFLNPFWPVFTAYTGELDMIGDKKVNSYYLDVVWKRSIVEMLVHTPIPDGYQEQSFYYNFPIQSKSWTFPGNEGKKMQVYIYSRAEKVKLELNGKKIGEQAIDPDKITARFDVPYEPGLLIAKSYRGDKLTGTDTLRTTGKPFALRLIADRATIKADRNDLSYVKAEVVDENGLIVPYVDNIVVKYYLQGTGEIAGVANGNPYDATSFQKHEKKVFHGKGLVIVRPTGGKGVATLTATAKGLKGSTIQITIK